MLQKCIPLMKECSPVLHYELSYVMIQFPRTSLIPNTSVFHSCPTTYCLYCRTNTASELSINEQRNSSLDYAADLNFCGHIFPVHGLALALHSRQTLANYERITLCVQSVSFSEFHIRKPFSVWRFLVSCTCEEIRRNHYNNSPGIVRRRDQFRA